MSKNRELGNIVGPDATTGHALTYNSDNTLSFSEVSANLTDLSTYTISADADPAASTNPSAAGALWLNQDTNQLYICMDATTDANVWKGLTFESPPVPYAFQGSNYGYTSGGYYGYNVIDNFPFSSATTNATDVGDLTVNRFYLSGQSSADYGYTSGGYPSPLSGNVIDRFPFVNGGNATDVGDLTGAIWRTTGQSSENYGYVSGGSSSPTQVTTIQRFSFATGTESASSFATLSIKRASSAGQSDIENDYGWNSGGLGELSVIDKFPFASGGTSTDSGNLSANRYQSMGQSSTDYGYTSGGVPSPVGGNVIDRFPFASGGNATDVGNLTSNREWGAGQSSTTHGYITAGNSSVNIIERFPFSSATTNATDVGDLTVGRYSPAGQQY
jgi:hypothetical protein